MIIETIPAIQKANLKPGIGTKGQTKLFQYRKRGYSDVKEEDEMETRESEIKKKEFKTQEETLPDVCLRWTRNSKSSLYRGYGKGSKSSSQRYQ